MIALLLLLQEQAFDGGHAVQAFNGGANLRVGELEKPGPTGRPAIDLRVDCPKENAGLDVLWSFPPVVLDGKTFSVQMRAPDGPVPYARAEFLDAQGKRVSHHAAFSAGAEDWRTLSYKVESAVPVARVRLQFCGSAGKSVHVMLSDFADAGRAVTKRVDTSALGAPTLAKEDVELWLDAAKGYTLTAARVGAARFEREIANAYPRFQFLRADGTRLEAEAVELSAKAEAPGRIRYSREGTTVEVAYAIDGGLRCDVKLVEEGSLKLVAVGVDRMLGAELGGGDYGILPTGALWPRGETPRAFKRMGNADNMVPNFGAAKLGGRIVFYKPMTASQEMNVAASNPMLWFGGRLFFRPSKTKNPATKLCHPALSWRLETAGDENKDGAVDWVDAGVAYRDRHMKKNASLDPSVRDSLKFYHGMPGDTYARLAATIEKMDYAPTLWWVKGAMTTLVEQGSECHPYTVAPDPKRGERVAFPDRARVGIYYGHDYLDNFNKDWPDELIKRDPDGNPSPYYLHRGHRLLHKDNVRGLASGALTKHYDEILRVCALPRGSPVMLDTFTAYGREGYHPDFPATPQVETDAKREICRWMKKERGMSIAGESVIEGTEDMLDFGAILYDFQSLQDTRFWTRDDWVPLPSVIYHGRTYTGVSVYEYRKPDPNWAASLVTGCSMWQWSTGHYPDMYAVGARMFFHQNIVWAQTADAEMVDVDRTGTEYRIRYSNGHTLWTDPEKRAWRLEAGGVTYDGFTPFNALGVMAILKQGDFDLTLPVKDMLEVLPSQPDREKLDVRIEAAADGRIRVRGNFSKVPWKMKHYHKVVETRDVEPVLLLRRKK